MSETVSSPKPAVGSTEHFAANAKLFATQTGDPTHDITKPIAAQQAAPAAQAEGNEENSAGEREPVSEAPPDPKTPGSNKRWDELKAIEKQWKAFQPEHQKIAKEAEELKAWKAEQEKRQVVPADQFERVKKELSEYQARIKKLDITMDPEFERTITGPMKSKIDEAVSILPEAVRETAAAALRNKSHYQALKDIERIKDADGVEPEMMVHLKYMAGQIHPLVEAHHKALADIDGLHARREEEMRQKQAETIKHRNAQLDSVINEALSSQVLSPLFKGETPEQQEAGRARMTKVRQIFSSMDSPDNQASASVWSVVGPELFAEVTRLNSEIAKLSKRSDKVKELGVTTPTNKTPVNTEEKLTERDMSVEAIRQRMLIAQNA
jgi:hypothetical protein